MAYEILDLRHFSALLMRPLLDAEGEVWEERLHWDYRGSARLLMQYLDNRMLPGFAAVSSGKLTGYVFCVYEETKAVIGDVFAVPGSPNGTVKESETAQATAETLLRHLWNCCSTRRMSIELSRNCCCILRVRLRRSLTKRDSASSAASFLCSH